MRTIIHIEEDKNDYKIIFNLLKKKGYSIIPRDDEEFDRMAALIANGKVWQEFLEPKIIENQKDLGLILMDLNFQSDEIEGADLIYKIRNELNIPGKYFLSKLIPIISFTNYAGKDFANKALKAGATHNVPKDKVIRYIDKKIIGLADDIHFVSIISSMIGYYDTAYYNKDQVEILNGIADDLEFQKKLIKSGFDDIELLIQGNEEEILQKFDILFKIMFESFDKDTKHRVFNTFPDDLSQTLSKDQIDKLNQGLWEQIKNSIKDVNKGGGFKEFVDTTYELLSEAKIIEGKGKIIGIAIKGIFGILSS